MTAYYIKKSGLGIQSFRKILKIAGLGFVLIGTSFFLYFFFPVLSYQFFLANAFDKDKIEVPIPKYLVVNKNNDLGSLVASGIVSLTSDFTDARNWYPALSPQAQSKIESYSLSIPSL